MNRRGTNHQGLTISRALRMQAATRKRLRALNPMRRLEKQVEDFERRVEELMALSNSLAN